MAAEDGGPDLDHEGQHDDSTPQGVILHLMPNQVSEAKKQFRTAFKDLPPGLVFPLSVSGQYIVGSQFQAALTEEQHTAIQEYFNGVHGANKPARYSFELRAQTGQPDDAHGGAVIVVLTCPAPRSTRVRQKQSQQTQPQQPYPGLSPVFRERLHAILRAACKLDEASRDSVLQLHYLLQGTPEYGTDAVLQELELKLRTCTEQQSEKPPERSKKRRSGWQMFVQAKHDSITPGQKQGVSVTSKVLSEQWQKLSDEEKERWQAIADQRNRELQDKMRAPEDLKTWASELQQMLHEAHDKFGVHSMMLYVTPQDRSGHYVYSPTDVDRFFDHIDSQLPESAPLFKQFMFYCITGNMPAVGSCSERVQQPEPAKNKNYGETEVRRLYRKLFAGIDEKPNYVSFDEHFIAEGLPSGITVKQAHKYSVSERKRILERQESIQFKKRIVDGKS